MRIILAALAGLALAGAAAAEPLTARQAGRALFPARGSEVGFPASPLSAQDRATLELLFRLSARDIDAKTLAAAGIGGEQAGSVTEALKLFRDAKYYGAMAASPSKGIVSPATQMVQNLHSPAAARAAALARCAGEGGRDCTIVAEVLPKRFRAQDFTLSQAATGDFAAYRKGKGPKAMAISAATGAYAVARGYGSRNAAVQECNRLAGTADCAVAVYDE